MFNISNICRICLEEEYPKLPIFSEDDGKSESKPTLPEKIMSFAQVTVVKNDGLPMYICVKCYCQVDTTVEFKRLCEESFHYFKRQLDTFSNLRAISPPPQNEKENDGQHHTLPEDCIKVEECKPEYQEEEEPGTQVFTITDSDESWVHNEEEEMDTSIIKCGTSLDYPNIEFDPFNVKIENVSDNYSNEEHVNPLKINLEDSKDPEAQNVDDLMSTSNASMSTSNASMLILNASMPTWNASTSTSNASIPTSNPSTSTSNASIPTSNVEKTCKCRSCEMVFTSRRELAFHISFAHRRCSMCSKYFYLNKDKDEHVCSQVSETDKINQNCHMCNTTVNEIKSHMACHNKTATEVPDANQEANVEKDTCATPMEIQPESEMTDIGISCSLCDFVCLNEKGFKVHLRYMHPGHRLIYPCFKCKSQEFSNKDTCVKHLSEEHGVTATENVQFELKEVGSDTKTKGRQQRKLKKNNYKSKKRSNLRSQCLEQTKDCDLEKKASRKPKVKKTEVNPRKCVRVSHPPFTHSTPIIRSNFNVTMDHKGIKSYVCRGCDVTYKGYVAAYNHYYTYNKRKAAAAEENDLVKDGKLYDCAVCKLTFASGSQAMMHLIHTHKYLYKKYAMEKK